MSRRAGRRAPLASTGLLVAVLLLVTSSGLATAASGPTTPTAAASTIAPGGPATAALGHAGGPPAASTSPYPALAPNSSRPVNATLGYFDGYWYNSTLDVTPSDGLNRTELTAYVDRVMARDELILGRNFKRPVPVSIVSRQAYQANRTSGTRPANGTYSRWNNVVWRGTFLVGADQNVQQVLAQFYGGQVQGYYAPGPNHIVIITPTGSSAYIDPATLAHELAHANQDQYDNLSRPAYNGRTQDQQLAIGGLVEGQAKYVQLVYQHECSTGGWSCLAKPTNRPTPTATATATATATPSPATATPTPTASLSTGTNYGVEWVLYFPYAMGPQYVDSLLQRGGPSAVAAAFRSPPASSSTVIHDTPVVPDTIRVSRPAAHGWHRYRGVGINGTDTPGEATIYAMLWWQSAHDGAGLVPASSIFRQGAGPFDQYNYTSAASSGWAGGTLVPYHKPGQPDGFVWVTTWRTPTDARQFASAYRTILQAHGATHAPGATDWTVAPPDGFAGTYRVAVNGTRVTIVEGPTAGAVAELQPHVTVTRHASTAGGTPTGTATPSPAQRSPSATAAAGSPANASTPRAPGFGFVVALVGLLLAVGVLLRRRR